MTIISPTVYVIDDDEGIRSSLTRSLGKRGFTVQTFASAQDFLDAYTQDFFGCIILDQGMPGMTGLELQQILIASGHPLPIIFITGHAGVPESVLAIKSGAIDFLEKPFRSDVLVDRINTAFEALSKSNSERHKIVEVQTRFEMLTPREREVVDHIVSNPSRTTSKDIARALSISPRTVDHHRARLLEKLQINSILDLIEMHGLAAQGATKPQ